MKRSANSAFLFVAQKLCAVQPTQVRRTFVSELNVDIEDTLSTLGFSPYKYPTNLALEIIPFAVLLASHSLSILFSQGKALGRSSSVRKVLEFWSPITLEAIVVTKCWRNYPTLCSRNINIVTNLWRNYSRNHYILLHYYGMLLFIHTLVMIVMMNVIAIMNVMCYNMDME